MHLLQQLNPDIVKASWNFSEAGHGKGAVEGIGGVVKRTADRLVLQGKDIASVDGFIHSLKEPCSGIMIIKVKREQIAAIKSWLPEVIPSICGMTKLRQVTWTAAQASTVYLRSYTCFECEL